MGRFQLTSTGPFHIYSKHITHVKCASVLYVDCQLEVGFFCFSLARFYKQRKSCKNKCLDLTEGEQRVSLRGLHYLEHTWLFATRSYCILRLCESLW